MRIVFALVTLFAAATPAWSQVPMPPAQRSAASAQILAGQVVTEIETLKLFVTTMPPVFRNGVTAKCNESTSQAAELQRMIATLQPHGQLLAKYRDLERVTDQLVDQIRRHDANNFNLQQYANRVDGSVDRLGAALNFGPGVPVVPPAQGGLPETQRLSLLRLARAVDRQAESLLAVARASLPRDRFGQAVEDEVRSFARSADRLKDTLAANTTIDQVAREFVPVQQRWTALAQTVNGIGLVPYPQVRQQAAQVDQTYRLLAAALGQAPAQGAGPLFPINNGREQGIIVVGAGEGGQPIVRVFQDRRGQVHNDFMAYDVNFQGGVRVAVGDVNGDGVMDVICAPGPGGEPLIRVFDGRDLSLLSQFYAYDQRMPNGVYVAAADISRKGRAEIVTGAGDGASPHVRCFDGMTGQVKAEMFAYDERSKVGARVALGDVDGDGVPDVIVAPGPGAEPLVRVFNGRGLTPMKSFFAYEQAFLGGVYVAAADVNGNGRAEVVTGAGANGGPHVRMFDPMAGRLVGEFFAFDSGFLGGVRVAMFDADRTRQPFVMTAAGPGGSPAVRMFRVRDGKMLSEFSAYDPRFSGGAFIAGN